MVNKCRHAITVCPLGKFSCFFVAADFFQNPTFSKILSELPSECLTDWIQIRPDVLSGLTWVQSVCKGYQATSLVGKELNRDNCKGIQNFCRGILLVFSGK